MNESAARLTTSPSLRGSVIRGLECRL
jgi:hypothetical protein